MPALNDFLNTMLDRRKPKETTAEAFRISMFRIACLRERDMTQKQAAASGFTM